MLLNVGLPDTMRRDKIGVNFGITHCAGANGNCQLRGHLGIGKDNDKNNMPTLIR